MNYRKKTGRGWMLSQKGGNGSSSLYDELEAVTRETMGFDGLKPFGLVNFVVCFAALLTGLLLSTVSFIFEVGRGKRKKLKLEGAKIRFKMIRMKLFEPPRRYP